MNKQYEYLATYAVGADNEPYNVHTTAGRLPNPYLEGVAELLKDRKWHDIPARRVGHRLSVEYDKVCYDLTVGADGKSPKLVVVSVPCTDPKEAAYLAHIDGTQNAMLASTYLSIYEATKDDHAVTVGMLENIMDRIKKDLDR